MSKKTVKNHPRAAASAKRTTASTKRAAKSTKRTAASSKSAAKSAKRAAVSSKRAAKTTKRAVASSKRVAKSAKRTTASRKRAATSSKRATASSERAIVLAERALALAEHDDGLTRIELAAPHNVIYLGEPRVLSRHTPPYMPNSDRELLIWIDQYITTADAHRNLFPAIFNGTGIFQISTLRGLRLRLDEAFTSIDSLMSLLRAVRTWKNLLFYNTDTKAVQPPQQEPGMVPPNQTSFSGIVTIIDQQVQLLRVHPAFNEVLARQFGIVPQPPSSVPASYDPQVRAEFTGGAVVLRFRAAGGRLGADVAEIRVDRGDGKIQFIGSTTLARFTDHPDLPEVRTVWTYLVNYADRNGTPVGVQSKADVAVQAMSL